MSTMKNGHAERRACLL